MKKILVTTDLSNNSKAGLLFAIQLASQTKFELTFLHVYNIIPTAWDIKRVEEYEKTETKIIQEKLNRFVDKIYKRLGFPNTNKNCVIHRSIFPQSAITEYAEENKFNFICISTRGAGKFERFLGTNTSYIINNSAIPIIAVPHNYKSAKKITTILYASDLVNLEKELKSVVDFAKPLKSKVELLHFTTPLESLIDAKILEMAIKKLSKYDVKMNIKNTDVAETMIANLEKALKKTKPSMLIMFTEQNRTLFQKIFLSSVSAEFSFNAKIPLLVFNKS